MDYHVSCSEFRSLYNRWLDARKSSPLPPGAVLHGCNCSACGKYASAMRRVDAGLQDIPDLPIPGELLGFSVAAGAHAPGCPAGLSSQPGVGAAFAISVLVAWSISLFVPPPWQFAAQFLLVSGGVVLFAVTSLSPRFMAEIHGQCSWPGFIDELQRRSMI